MSDDDDQVLADLERALMISVPTPSAARVAAVRAAAATAQQHHRDTGGVGISTRRALLMSTAAAVAGAVGGAAVVTASRDDAPATPAGPPTEALSFSSSVAAAAGSLVSGHVINHTWGVELLLDATGLDVGAAYRVVYIAALAAGVDRADVDAGGFIGAAKPIHCRCNAPLLRDAIAAIEIRDTAGAVVSRADFT